MINDPDIAKFVYDNGLTIIDEYDPKILSQTKGSGGHLHLDLIKGLNSLKNLEKNTLVNILLLQLQRLQILNI